jgi:hypothetical protein
MFLRNFIQYIDDTFRVTKEEENGECPLQQQTVGAFILENEGNLGIAVEVARAFPAIQRQIVQRAMDALEKQLRSRLGEKWDVWTIATRFY